MPSLEELLTDHGRFTRDLAADVVGDGQTGEDLLQEAWLRSSGEPRALRQPQAWLKTVVRNLGRSLRRSEASRRDRERQTSRPERLPSVLDELEHSELLLQIATAVQALPEPYRGVILKRYWEDLTPAQIAQTQGVPLATVKSRLQRGLTRLRAEGDVTKASPFEALLAIGLGRNDVVAQSSWIGTVLMNTQGKLAITAVLIATTVLVGVLPRLTDPRTVGAESGASSPDSSLEQSTVMQAAVDSALRQVSPVEEGGARQSAASLDAQVNSPSGFFAVSGRVVDVAGEVVAGAAIELHSARDGTGTVRSVTDAEGLYRMEFSSGGALQLSASHPSCVTRTTQFYLPEPKAYELADLVLRGGQNVIGRVIDESGVGVGGATIVLLERQDRTGSVDIVPLAESAADGSFSCPQFSTPGGELGVLASGFVPVREAFPTGNEVAPLQINISRGWSAEVEIIGVEPEGPPLRLAVLPATGSQFGESEMDWSLHTYRGAQPIVRRLQTLTGLAHGNAYYALLERQLPGGSWERCGEQQTIDEEEPHAALHYPSQTRVHLSARDSESGALVTELEVWREDLNEVMRRVAVSPLDTEVGEGAEHSYSFYVDPDEWIQLTVTAEGYASTTIEPFQCVAGQHDVSRTCTLRAALRRTVQVRDARTGQPIEGAQVRTELVSVSDFALLRGSTHRTAEDGRASWTQWEEENAELVVSHSDYSVHREPNPERVTSNEVWTVDLEPLAQVLVHVTRHDGRPAAGVLVQCDRVDDSGVSSVEESSDLGGVARFQGLEPGPYEISFAQVARVHKRVMMGGAVASISIVEPDESREVERVALAWGDVIELHLQQPPRYFLEGRVFQEGVPLAGARVHVLERSLELDMLIHHTDPGDPQAVTGSLGFFRIEAIAGGDVTLYVEHDQRRFPWSDTFRLDGDLQGLRVELPLAELKGTVRDQAGKPIAGAEVEVIVLSPDGSYITAPRVMTVDSAGIFSMMTGEPEGERVTTDGAGCFTIENPPLGHVLRVEASHFYFRTSMREVLLEDSGERELEFALSPAGGLRVGIAMADQSPVRNAYVRLAWKGAGEQESREASLGNEAETQFSGLEPGEWEVAVSVMGADVEGVVRSCVVRVGETAWVGVVLER